MSSGASGNDHVKALIFKLQCLGIHSFKFNIPALFSDKFCIFFSQPVFQNSRSEIFCCYMITLLLFLQELHVWKSLDLCRYPEFSGGPYICLTNMIFFGKFIFYLSENFFVYSRIVFESDIIFLQTFSQNPRSRVSSHAFFCIPFNSDL